MPQKTLLHDMHEQLGGRIVDFAGWLLPVQYASVLAEHRRCRSDAVVFDTSHMGQIVIEGEGAAGAIGAVCTQDAAGLTIGRCRYGYLLNRTGGVIDDTILMRLAEDRFLLVVNAGTRGRDLEHVRQHLPDGVAASDRLDAGWGKVDLQGPRAPEVLAPLVDDLPSMPFFSVRETTVAGRPVTLARTGYTGELGWEIMAAGDELRAIFETLLAHDAVGPAGLGARDSLRLEMGYPLYGHELNEQTTPLEAGGDRFLDLDRDFLGVEALRTQAEQGPERTLVALKSDQRRRAAPDDEIHATGPQFPEHRRHVGSVTSGGFSPSLECSIALGYVRRDIAEPGAEVMVKTARAELPMTVVDLPFYTEGACRKKLTS